MGNKYDVIIAGAGVAGLAAAQILRKRRLKIKIIEARERIGGRILTWRDKRISFPIELGAEFIHGHPRSFERAKAFGLTLYDVEDAHAQWSKGKLTPNPDFWTLIGRVMKKNRSSARDDRSFATFLESVKGFEKEKKLALFFVEGFHACSPQLISALSLAQIEKTAEKTDGNRAYKLFEGYDHLLLKMFEALRPEKNLLELNSCIKRIDWSQDIEVFFQRSGKKKLESVKSKKALVTLPLGVLKAAPGSEGAVTFFPSLEEKERAFEGLEMGQVIRFIFLFRENFWSTEDPMGFIHAFETSFRTFWTTAPIHSNVITAWAGGNRAIDLLKEGFSGAQKKALESLAKVTGKSFSYIKRQHIKTFYHNWMEDPFARGAYSYVKVGGMQDQKVLAAPEENRLFFAGEATDLTGEAGTVNGAILSGERAAREILESL